MVDPSIYLTLYRRVLYFEWILLSLCALGEYVAWQFAPPDPTAPSNQVALILIAVFACLSFVVPTRQPYWDKVCFLFLQIVILTGAAALGLPRFVFPLYAVVLAKACLILDRGGLLIIGWAAFLSQVAYASYKLVLKQPQLIAGGWSLKTFITLFAGSILMTYGAIMVMVLVALLTLALVAEQRSRLRAEQLSREVEQLARELERTQIARDIHDSLGHTLTSLNIQLDVARKFAQVDPARSGEAVELAKELASQTLTDVRMAVQSIRKADFDFRAELEALLDRIKRSQTLEIDCRLDIPAIPSTTGYQLYRVIQECLTNVLKHAEASKVSIELKHTGEHVQVSIADDGRGLGENTDGRGFGLKGIKERVEGMHGSVSLSGEGERGTRIEVTIPL
jgi:signal transduction histidine kinase